MEAPFLKSITTFTKDGEWGKGEPFDSSVEMTVIRGTDFEDARVGFLDGAPSRHIPGHIAIRKRLQAFDILIETAGGSKERPTGRTLLVKPSLISKSTLPLTCASFARFIRIDRQQADPTYVFWLLQHLYNAGMILQYHTQHTGVARFQFTTFAEREPLPLPPLIVQKRIASILSAYDDLIENNTRRVKILQDIAQMIYREWFVNFRFPGHEKVRMVESDSGPIPEEWVVSRVSDFGAIVTGKTPSTTHPEFFGTDVPFIKTPDMHGNMFCLEVSDHLSLSGADSQKNKTIPANTVIVNCIGALAGSVSLTTKQAQTNQQINSVVLNSQSTREFLYYSLVGLRETLRSIGSNGATMINVNKSKFEELKITTPPSGIIEQFHAVAFPAFEMIRNLQARILNLRTTRDFLLPKLISGEIIVQAAAELVEQIA